MFINKNIYHLHSHTKGNLCHTPGTYTTYFNVRYFMVYFTCPKEQKSQKILLIYRIPMPNPVMRHIYTIKKLQQAYKNEKYCIS